MESTPAPPFLLARYHHYSLPQKPSIIIKQDPPQWPLFNTMTPRAWAITIATTRPPTPTPVSGICPLLALPPITPDLPRSFTLPHCPQASSQYFTLPFARSQAFFLCTLHRFLSPHIPVCVESRMFSLLSTCTLIVLAICVSIVQFCPRSVESSPVCPTSIGSYHCPIHSYSISLREALDCPFFSISPHYFSWDPIPLSPPSIY